MEDISLISNENDKPKVVNLKKEGVNIMRAYDLIIDYHRNSPTLNNVVEINGNNVARGMFVLDKWSPNFQQGEFDSNGIVKYMDRFNENIMRCNFYYQGGINSFNTDLSENIVLLEAGDVNNDKLEVMRLNTYMASAIDSYLENN